MALQTKPRLSPEDYLAIERSADYKSEYLNGEIFAMVGASEPHNLIVANTIAELRQQLKKRPCKVYPSIALRGCIETFVARMQADRPESGVFPDFATLHPGYTLLESEV